MVDFPTISQLPPPSACICGSHPQPVYVVVELYIDRCITEYCYALLQLFSNCSQMCDYLYEQWFHMLHKGMLVLSQHTKV